MIGRTTKKRIMRAAGRGKAFRPVLMLLVCLYASLSSACLPEPPPTPTPTPTATVTITPTPTATIVWFPPTVTYTPAPTHLVEPTQDMRPALGSRLLEDDFGTPSQWQTGKTEAGSVAFGKQELTLAVSAPKGTLHSLRKMSQLGDFYAEVDALPSLCRAGDAYGVLVRATSGQDYYRVLVNCNAQLRVERVKSARMLVLKDWTPSGQLLPGGLLSVRLGVWAVGSEVRVFVNQAYQFSLRDPTFETGVLGVYARAAGDTPLTVNFSNLAVYAVETGRIPTPAPSPTPSLPPTATRRPSVTAGP